jgi:hypothetical protein
MFPPCVCVLSMEQLQRGRLPQVRLAVGCLGAHAITIVARGIARARSLTTVGPTVMVRSWLSADGKILLTRE